MDKKQLEALLSEIAEWTYPSVSLDNAQERVIPTTGKKEYKHVYTPKPDLGPRIVKLHKKTPCEWCHKDIEQRQNITKQVIPRRGTSPEIIRWHYSCYNCHRVWDPVRKELQAVSQSLTNRRKKK